MHFHKVFKRAIQCLNAKQFSSPPGCMTLIIVSNPTRQEQINIFFKSRLTVDLEPEFPNITSCSQNNPTTAQTTQQSHCPPWHDFDQKLQSSQELVDCPTQLILYLYFMTNIKVRNMNKIELPPPPSVVNIWCGFMHNF